MIVPFNQSSATRQARGVPAPMTPPPDVFLAMAAAQMHERGRLFEPEPKTEIAGDVVQSGLSERLRDIQKSTAPTSPQPGVPPAKIIPIGKG